MNYTLVSANAKISCIHGGQVQFQPSLKILINGITPICWSDLMNAPITGCPIAATTTSKPCTQIMSLSTGESPNWLKIADKKVLLSNATGNTDGLPTATWQIDDPGQEPIEISF